MRRYTGLSAVLCALTLGGCVAAPLAQLAISQMSPTKPPCPGCSAEAGVFDGLSKGVTDSFHKLTGAQVAAAPPAK